MGSERKRYTRAELVVRVASMALMAGVLLLLAFLSVLAAWNIFLRYELAKQDATTSQKDLVQITSRYDQAKADVARLSSSLGVEAALRQQFGVLKPGEGEIILVGGAATTSAISAPSQNGFWSQLWNMFR